ncbi:uncharacterized protein LOC107759784 isoform X2 [Nicotiana tabacum]|uniref:Uncharacterized protein LOC107759784 isoform X2 n=2 Tax=Nicotiana TaxID=4085 RepID=A0A1S3X0G2_TOBAC|nr:PREDICTED: uncharacterized protein LOC104223434 [Nicotiana sylvestris]XP_016433281.1 PREDICTED: uncharacterized protein LOC107759784 [Nicotiana tabacum]
MDESNYYLMNRSHIPAFGSWDCNDDFPVPFTECFESARQADLFRYSYSNDRDLYVAGDLYQNDIVTPAMIVVPRRKRKASSNEVGGKKEAWVVRDYEYDVKKAATPSPPPPPTPPKRAVDEDLYKISPELLYSKSKRKGVRGFFSMCLRPTCAS